jgi:FixJ family two-component response regulator
MLHARKLARPPKAPVISIVDDDKSVRAATDRLMRSLGFVAYTFASAEEFLHSPQLQESSCVITDIRMPGMGGMELQKFLIDKDHHLPIIFITAFPDEVIEARALEAGAVAFLIKPFDGKNLIKSLSTALKKSEDDTTEE